MVVGRPIEVPQVVDPSPEVVAEYLDRYCREVEALFHRYVLFFGALFWSCLFRVFWSYVSWLTSRLYPSPDFVRRHKHKYAPGETIEIS